MLKTHKIALNPNNVQATQFAQHCGYARVAYNHVLADFKEGLANGEWHSHIELNKRFIVNSKNKETLSPPMFGRRCFQLRRLGVSQ